ncbi:unnamed protein product [Rhizoctonia solani]|uniref:Magnesium transporter NIPA-domain-containing protein n=1 Tax=Rhizoctonia solani TaxID=456999 RepID=A0A8H3CDY2_9AGAM|nr:unnamed protein product [Rhizoctonia solani]CAE6516462.1 unnamed protein product [Rhizoctonia solani]
MSWAYDWIVALGSNKGSNATFIGVVVAVCGNVLISIALNFQKLSHRRIEAAYRSKHVLDNDTEVETTIPTYQAVVAPPVDLLTPTQRSQSLPIATPRSHSPVVIPRQAIPLVVSSSPVESIGSRPNLTPRSRTQSSIFNHATIDEAHEGSSTSTSRAEPADGTDLEAAVEPGSGTKDGPEESAYLHSKLWWFGFTLMNIGEVGNFLSYAYAPASLVAPLGAVALIANCFFAPLILHERFRKQDLLGIGLSILGAMTVVYASQSSSARLDPDALIYAITRIPFVIWAIINVVAIILLSGLSSQRTKLENSGWMQGDRWALVDVGLCALFGGFTVLSTKAVSSLLSTEWANVFTEWIFYPSILVLGLTGVGQIRHLNRALHFHESRVVIPTQFVLFNLTAIVGSAILYHDFDKINFHRFLTFFYGCCTTFLGVYLITRPSNPPTPTTTPRPSRTPSQTTPLLPKSLSSKVRQSAAAARHRTISRRGSNSSLNVVGLSPGPYLLLATPSGSPGMVAVPVTPDRHERSRSRSTARGQTR